MLKCALDKALAKGAGVGEGVKNGIMRDTRQLGS